HLAYTMRNKNDRRACCLQSGNDVAEPVDVTASKRGGGFVEKKDAWLAVDGPRDFNLLTNRKLQCSHFSPKIDGEVQALDMTSHGITRHPATDQPGHALRR